MIGSTSRCKRSKEGTSTKPKGMAMPKKTSKTGRNNAEIAPPAPNNDHQNGSV